MAQRIEVSSLAQLLKILDSHHIGHSSWGQNGTKNVGQLFDEITNTNECELVLTDAGELRRRVSAVKMRIHEPGLGTLMEVRQIKKDDTVRRRKVREPSGKIGHHESVEDALVREMKEELRLIYELGDYTYLADDIKTEEESSSSYPGLMSQYVFYWFDITLSATSLLRVLPEGHVCLDPETGTIIHCEWVK